MADLQQLYGALEKADAAGDVEGARQLANWIRAEQSAPDMAVSEPVEVPPPEPKTGFSSFVPAVKRSVAGIGSLFGDVAPAMVARAGEKVGITGAKDYADRQMAEAAAEQQRIQQMYPSAVPSYTDIKGGGDLLTYVVESVGELIPSMLPSILTGGVAGIAGRGAVVAAEQAAKSAAQEAAKRELMKDSVQAAIKSGAYGGQQETLAAVRSLALEAGLKAGKEAAQKTALKYEAAGAIAGSASQNIPEVYQNVAQETGKEDLGAALLFGIPNSVLDALTPLNLLRKAKGSGITPNELVGAWYKRGAKGLATGFVTEGATEAAQEASSAAAEKFVDNNKEFFTSENLERFLNAGLKGGIGGGVATGATNVAFGSKDKQPELAAQINALANNQPPPAQPPVLQTQLSDEQLKNLGKAKEDLGTADVIPAPDVVAEIAKLEKENTERKAKIDKGEAHPRRVKKYEETNARIEALKAQGAQNVNREPIASSSGVSAGVSGEPGAGDAAAGTTTSGPAGVADTTSAASVVEGGEGTEQRTLEQKPFIAWLADKGYADKNPNEVDFEALKKEWEAETAVAKSEEVLPEIAKEAEAAAPVEVAAPPVAKKKGKQKLPTLVIPPGDREVTTEITQPAPFQGETVSGTERRFIEPKQIEEDLYPAAIQRRGELQVLEAAAKESEIPLEEKIKRNESIERVRTATNATINNDPDAKKLYRALKADEKAKHNTVVEKYKKQKENVAQPMRKRKEKQPPGITYSGVTAYKKQVAAEKREAKAAAKAKPEDKPLSLAEQRLADFRATKSQYKDAEGNITYSNLEALEELRGTTTIGLMSNLMHGDLRGALQEIANNATGEFTKLDVIVAKRLLESDTLPTVQVVPSEAIDGKRGRYDAATDAAYISEDAMNSHTVLHETLHGFTLAIIKAHKDGVKLNQGVANLEKLYNHLKENYPDLAGKYGMENLAEFVSEVMSNPDFQEQLNAIPYERGNLLINAFVDFVKSILNLLRISPGSDFTALGYALISTESILNEGRNLEVTNPPPAQASLDAQAKKEPKPAEYTGPKTIPELIEALPDIQDSPAHSIKKALEPENRHSTYENAIKALQNTRRAIYNWGNRLAKANKINYYGEDQNDIPGEIAASGGRAEHLFNFYISNPSKALYNAIGNYSRTRGIDEKAALKELQMIFTALHEPERRATKYLLNVPLPLEAAQQRERIMNTVRSNQVTPQQVETILRPMLRELVANNQLKQGQEGYGARVEDGPSKLPLDKNAAEYNVVGNVNPILYQQVLKDYYGTSEQQALVKPIKDAINQLQNATIELDTRANYWSRPVSNLKALYGYENYIPFKGKPDEKQSISDEELEYDSPRNGRELQEAPYSFEGRLSQPENPLLQTLADGVRSAMRAGRGGTEYDIEGKPVLDKNGQPAQFGLTHSIVNAIKQKLLPGDSKPVITIPFEKRSDPEIIQKLKEKGENNFFHYLPDGTIEVWAITDPVYREAIRRTYQKSNPLLDTFSRVTSWIGQSHTRYNPAFAPKNFIGDTLANAGIIGAEMGVGKFGAVVGQVAKNGLGRAFTFSKLYSKKNFAEIERLAKTDDYIKDMYDYVKNGGKVSYVSGLGAQSQFQKMQENLGRTNVASSKEAIDEFLDAYWAEPFELASRVAAYRVTKAEYMNKGMDEKAASTRATTYVKNLANFEQTGDYGKVLGSFFMFFRASATGAVRALDALAPIFRDPAAEWAHMPTSVKEDISPAGIRTKEEFFANMAKQRRTAMAMLAAIGGTGVAVYMMALAMADGDDEGRNRTATDDMDRWTRFARFPIPGTDKIVQIPWGFGLGAFAAAGAQIAALLTGNSSFGQAFNNIKDVGMDSFVPLPTSKINMYENPAAWAMDSITPSIARPFFEYAMNMDGLGREIYNNRQSRVGDAYTGGDNIPELYKDAARMLANITNGEIDVSPNTMYFFANNYVDGLSRVIHNSYGVGMTVAGQKEFNPKTDTMIFDSFFGAPSNVDAREFSKVENQIKDRERKLNMFKSDPLQYADYVMEHPMDEAIVEIYNKSVGGQLNDLREQANVYRKMPGLSPKERKEYLEPIKAQQDLYKRHLISVFEAYNIKP
jgi:hypothetical protein